jgi:hypothetical protein
MRQAQEITSVGFNPPNDARPIVEAMTINELLQRAPAAHFAKLQRADFYRLIGVLEGHTSAMVDFSTYSAHAGDWLLVRPGQVFRYDFSRNWSGWLVVFRPDGLSATGLGPATDDVDTLRRVEDLTCLRSLNDQQHDWMQRSAQQLQLDGALTADVGLRNGLLRLQLASTLLHLSLWQSQDSVSGIALASEQANFRRFRTLLEAAYGTRH